jgi:hypothetical protein
MRKSPTIISSILAAVLFAFILFLGFKSNTPQLTNEQLTVDKEVVENTEQTNDELKKQEEKINQETNGEITYFVYFTGMYCPHCANVDHILLKEKVRKYNILVVEYEIHQNSQNGALLFPFHQKYQMPLGVPVLLADTQEDGMLIGDTPILEQIDSIISKFTGNKLLLNTQEEAFHKINFQTLQGTPTIWYKNRAAQKQEDENKEKNLDDQKAIKEFVIQGKIPQEVKHTEENVVNVAGNSVSFDNAVEYKGWKLFFDN